MKRRAILKYTALATGAAESAPLLSSLLVGCQADITEEVAANYLNYLPIPGPCQISMTCFGELLPYHENRMFLNFEKGDQHGMPIITFDAKLRDNDAKLQGLQDRLN